MDNIEQCTIDELQDEIARLERRVEWLDGELERANTTIERLEKCNG